MIENHHQKPSEGSQGEHRGNKRATTTSSSKAPALAAKEEEEATSVMTEGSGGAPDSVVVHAKLEWIRNNVIGSHTLLQTPFGPRSLVYADYTASGRFLSCVEDYMRDVVAPMYANTHTEASATGAQTTLLREEARDLLHRVLRAPKKDYAVLFTGTGSTGAMEKLMRVLGLDQTCQLRRQSSPWRFKKHRRPVVFVGPFEHHSNELLWRESLAEVVVIGEDSDGVPDLEQLERELQHYSRQTKRQFLMGSFSAGSNVTGIKADTQKIATMLHKYGALACFDFAGVGAYQDIDVQGPDETSSMDAIFLSPHKLVGGPGSSGILVARRRLFDEMNNKPTVAGGGTVQYVTGDVALYHDSIELREDAGTPGISQSIRAGLVFHIKNNLVGCNVIEKIETEYNRLVMDALGDDPSIILLGSNRNAFNDPTRRVPIFSFVILSPFDCARTSRNGEEYDMNGTTMSRNLGFWKRFQKDEKVAGRYPDDSNSFQESAYRNMPEPQRTSYIGASLSDTYCPHALSPKIPLHYNFVVALLNDLYGIQSRGGCSCAGPYGVRLLRIPKSTVQRLQAWVSERKLEIVKPGWTRVNMNYFIDKEELAFILEAVKQVAMHGWKLLPFYGWNATDAQFKFRDECLPLFGRHEPNTVFSMEDMSLRLGTDGKAKLSYPSPTQKMRSTSYYKDTLRSALKIFDAAYEILVQNKELPCDIHADEEKRMELILAPLKEGSAANRTKSRESIWFLTASDVVMSLSTGVALSWDEQPELNA